ncbi:MAG: HAMP domain-containing histidine kinase [Lachnospiraceae bacterium]|nr:HAMP domain-containing histidine kinase [Lachnospiraceae bacterium]
MRPGHSISRQFATIFIIVMAFAMGLIFLANNLLLKRFYFSNKQKEIISAYDSLNKAEAENEFDTDEYDAQIMRICEKYSLDLLVMDSNSQMVKSTGNDAKTLAMRLWDRIVAGNAGRDGDSDLSPHPGTDNPYDLILSEESYSLGLTKDEITGGEYMEMWGTLDSGNLFLIRTAVESMDNSVAITNRFLGYVSVIVIIISATVIMAVSKGITRPILKLADISKQMTELDFDARYEPKGDNEITLLGNNMNLLSDSLKKNISELKSANAMLKKDIEKKTEIDEMRKEFLSNVSHELKTPIALIQGYAEGLSEGVTDDPENMKYYCDVIVDEASKMNAMVQKLLTLNQLEFGAAAVDMERFDIVELIRGHVQTTEILTKQNGITINIPDGLPIYVWGDEYMVEEIITNYLSNAMIHCDNEKNIDIKVEDIEDRDKVKVIVFNTGAPIPEDSIDHIWEKFYKVDKARTREYGGNGVGLSIVAAMCKAMNQEYGVDNYDNGVGFYFTLDKR